MIQDKYDLKFRPKVQNNKWTSLERRTADKDTPPSDSFPLSLAGETDVSNNVRSAMGNGYSKLPMSPTEDMWTNEHQDAFYDDVGGFCERNNVLDRS